MEHLFDPIYGSISHHLRVRAAKDGRKMNDRLEQRIVVTGLGVVSCFGAGAEEFWQNLIAGRSGVSEVTCVRGDLPARLAGEVKNFDAAKVTSLPQASALGRTSQFAAAAARLAMTDAGLAGFESQRVGVVLGTTTGEQQVVESVLESLLEEKECDPRLMTQMSDGVIANNVADLFGLGACSVVLPAACSGGNFAIAYACELLRAGRVSLALAGGADCLSRHFFYGFARLGALAPEKCQPFDKNRKGIIPGEGAGIIVMETMRSALDRGARVYSQVLGYGLSSDAHHPVAPDPQARGAIVAMKDALFYSGIAAQEIDYISAHGTGTPINDRVEAAAIREVLGGRRVPVSSIKSMIGHPAGAASALEAIVCNLAIERGIIPPTINYEEPDPDCDLDCVPNVARRAEVETAMNNSQAFLGSNASVIFRKVRH
jgi:3-oxoacyl-[acyl-carrier-protein] synthase II